MDVSGSATGGTRVCSEPLAGVPPRYSRAGGQRLLSSLFVMDTTVQGLRTLVFVVSLAVALTSCATSRTANESDAVFATAQECPEGSERRSPKPVTRIDPKLPHELIGTGFSGEAVVEAIIDTDGTVLAVRRLKGDPRWAAEVVRAVRRWKFEPALCDGEPLRVSFKMTSRIR